MCCECFRKFCIWLWRSCCCLWLRRCCLCCCTFLWKCCCCLWNRRSKDEDCLEGMKLIDNRLEAIEKRGKNGSGYYSIKSQELEEIRKTVQVHLKDEENVENDKLNGRQSTFPAMCVLGSSKTTPNFAKKLSERLLDSGIKLFVTNTPCGNDPVIVICNIASRLETDINQAMELVKTIPQGRVILVALHLKREEYLPETDLRARLTNKTGFKDIGEMVDIGFDQNDIYDCVKNNSSIQKITKFVRDFKRLDMGENEKNDKEEEDYKNKSGSEERLPLHDSTDSDVDGPNGTDEDDDLRKH